ncbi:MAG: YgiQ family radical SAM protein [Lachnospiraceae bacterium]|nr:YgiQ family radical SAM protein [Lachnospiraceae bacterium]
MNPGFLPINADEIRELGWERPDFVFINGDAYVDHSSFGPAIISRVLEAHGYKVAMLAQPDWRNEASVTVCGEPRLGFLVSAGNMDSMVNHYTVNKKPRSQDFYSPGGKRGYRPDYATIVYCNLIRKKYGKIPILIGGIEASLRRLGHYDYWQDKMKRSILMDSGADILMYGMGELSIVEIADSLNAGIPVSEITYVPGTVYKTREIENVQDGIVLPDYDEIARDPAAYARSFNIQYRNMDHITEKPLIEKYGEKRYLVQNPPMRPLTTQEFDDVYELPYMNAWHPSYDELGGIPAFSEIKFSLTSNRGCFGGCSFCSLTFHQGRRVQVRSHESLIREAEKMTKEPDFKGYIHDVGGPTANFRHPSCEKQLKYGVCSDKQCLFPKPCSNLIVDHSDYVGLLRKLRNIPGVKKVFVRSGIRFDYVLADPDRTFLRELCEHHISGQLRTAPEHVSDHVLKLMGKPENKVYQDFVKAYQKVNQKTGKEQYCVPYLISSHPGSDLKDAVALAEAVRDMGYMPEQVQDFYPTPSTISTVMYCTGLDPRNNEKVVSAKDPHEKAMQRALIQYRKPENYDLVKEALMRCRREDLIGFDRSVCLISPRKLAQKPGGSRSASNGKKVSPKAGRQESGKSAAGKTATGKTATGKIAAGRTAAGRKGSGGRTGSKTKSKK